MRLAKDFYDENVVEVAKSLLGKRLVFNNIEGYITETEAYRGADDKASHAAKGMTKRSAIMFGPSAHSYVYMIYGMHYCLNVVCEPENSPAAVLIRGIQLPDAKIDGPGKLCRYFGVDLSANNRCLLTDNNFYIAEGIIPKEVKTTKRIGIKQGIEKQWRFVASL